ncbi:hypothetical protein [Roseateles sp. L2-2]|uniref:hypothetical protein n=1 Tax=Roseateles TaxID=93681 RepID=UPI003D362ABB
MIFELAMKQVHSGKIMKIKLLAFLATVLMSMPSWAQPAWGQHNLWYFSLPVGQEYIDYDSSQAIQFQVWIHVCGGSGSTPDTARNIGGYMVGLHVKDNKFLCAKMGSEHYTARDDFSTRRQGMHACPVGSAMVGINVNHDVLRCAVPVDGRILHPETERAADWGSRSGMHSCPPGWVMTGVHVNNNIHMCTATTGVGSPLTSVPMNPPIGGGGGGGGGGGRDPIQQD